MAEVETPATKACSRCGETKPLEAFSRKARSRRTGEWLLQAHCKTCVAAANRARRATPAGRAAHYHGTAVVREAQRRLIGRHRAEYEQLLDEIRIEKRSVPRG